MIMFLINCNKFVIRYVNTRPTIFLLCTTPPLLIRLVVSRFQVCVLSPTFIFVFPNRRSDQGDRNTDRQVTNLLKKYRP